MAKKTLNDEQIQQSLSIFLLGSLYLIVFSRNHFPISLFTEATSGITSHFTQGVYV